MLTYKPFNKVYKDDKDKYIQKLSYHLFRAAELARKIEKEYLNEKNNTNAPVTVINEHN